MGKNKLDYGLGLLTLLYEMLAVQECDVVFPLAG